jgi:hypothetical protein
LYFGILTFSLSRACHQPVPVFTTPPTKEAPVLVAKLFIPIIVEVEAKLGGPLYPLALSRSSGALLTVAQTNGGAAIECGSDGTEARCDVAMPEAPDAGCGVLGDGFGRLRNLVPSLAKSRVFEIGRHAWDGTDSECLLGRELRPKVILNPANTIIS